MALQIQGISRTVSQLPEKQHPADIEVCHDAAALQANMTGRVMFASRRCIQVTDSHPGLSYPKSVSQHMLPSHQHSEIL